MRKLQNYWGILILFICSCNSLFYTIDVHNVSNVYKKLDMKVFRGFVDKMTLVELENLHGTPDLILDAYDEAMVDDYNIYRYKFDDGTIDCYIKKDATKTDAIVDYIYYEPDNPILLNEFVLEDSLLNVIKKHDSDVNYVADGMRNFVRFRLDKKKRDKILNVALNDVSELYAEKNTTQWIKLAKGYVNVSLGGWGDVVDVTENGDMMVLTCIVESNLPKPISLKNIANDMDLRKSLMIVIFGEGSPLWYMRNSIMRENKGVEIQFYDNLSGDKMGIMIPSSEFEKIFQSGISNDTRLRAIMEINNIPLPSKVNDWLECQKMYVEDGNLVLPFIYFLSIEDIETNKIKQAHTELLSDENNPERFYFSMSARCNLGIKKPIFFPSLEDTIEIVYSPDEVKELVNEI